MEYLDKLNWDSKFFKKNIFSLTLNKQPQSSSQIENMLIKNDTDLCYIKSKTKIGLNDFKAYKNTYSSKQNIFRKKSNEGAFSEYSNGIYLYNHKNDKQFYEQIIELAFLSGHKSRFKKDKRFNQNEFEKLYKNWIDNTINKSFGDDLLLYVDSGELSGLITFSSKDEIAKVGLVAVKPTFQGFGIGHKLIKSFEKYYIINKNINFFEITTQEDNKAASSLYKKNGYTLIDEIYIYHIWKK
jgi:dTDP-4-amino-4,6-dideoxy-D-galactose acyltransferase